jgi:hypothetical protein
MYKQMLGSLILGGSEMISPISPTQLQATIRDDKVDELTRKSIPLYFETMQKMIVVSFSLMSPAKLGDNDFREVAGPFKGMVEVLSLSGRALHFFIGHCSHFPKSSLSRTIQFCGTLLKCCRAQLFSCDTWRRAQPVLSKIKQHGGMVDCASMVFFRSLCHSLGLLSQDIRLFCGWIQDQARVGPAVDSSLSTKATEKLPQDAEGEAWMYAHCHRKVSSLQQRSIKFLKTLNGVCEANNIAKPRLYYYSGLTSMALIPQQYCSDTNTQAPLDSKSLLVDESAGLQWLKNLGIGMAEKTGESRCNGEEDHEALSDESEIEQSSSATDSFGAIGDWGSGEE